MTAIFSKLNNVIKKLSSNKITYKWHFTHTQKHRNFISKVQVIKIPKIEFPWTFNIKFVYLNEDTNQQPNEFNVPPNDCNQPPNEFNKLPKDFNQTGGESLLIVLCRPVLF